MGEFDTNYLSVIICGFFVAFILAIATGANDAANSFGTTIGSGALKLRTAFILASIFEILGAVLLGMHVANKIRKGIVDTNIYTGKEGTLMLGYLATLLGASTWLFVATFFKIPVSCTHATVSAAVGFSLVARGSKGIKWSEVGSIAASWVLSPLTSGVISVLLFVFVEFVMMRSHDPKKMITNSAPLVCGVVVFVNVVSTLVKGHKVISDLPIWTLILIGVVAGVVSGVIVLFVACPKLMKIDSVGNVRSVSDIDHPEFHSDQVGQSLNQPEYSTHEQSNRDDGEKIFCYLQILTACFASFAHGSNDVSNSVAPLIAMWLIFQNGTTEEMNHLAYHFKFLLLLYGGIGITVGLWLCGRRVVETIGNKLAKIRPSTGFTIELGSATTVLLSSTIGFPVSTTHCKVGSVVLVGYADSKINASTLLYGEQKVDWKLFGIIFASWVGTIPAAMGCSAFYMFWLMIVAGE